MKYFNILQNIQIYKLGKSYLLITMLHKVKLTFKGFIHSCFDRVKAETIVKHSVINTYLCIMFMQCRQPSHDSKRLFKINNVLTTLGDDSSNLC